MDFPWVLSFSCLAQALHNNANKILSSLETMHLIAALPTVS
jgi:hypothetical protein